MDVDFIDALVLEIKWRFTTALCHQTAAGLLVTVREYGEFVRITTCSGSAWCFASAQGTDCRCRGTMLGPHCASLRQGRPRFRGSGAMLSPGWGHPF